MSTIAEIEAAIENLSASQIDELAGWLDTLRSRRATGTQVENWLQKARGSAIQGVTTASVMTLTRDDA
jgi:hypothetical protein